VCVSTFVDAEVVMATVYESRSSHLSRRMPHFTLGALRWDPSGRTATQWMVNRIDLRRLRRVNDQDLQLAMSYVAG
jgi:hypothetical protein